MADLATLQARLEAIQTARDSGVLMVRHGDTSTQFRTLGEMNAIIAALKREIAALSGTPRSKVNYIEQVHRGFGPPGAISTDGFDVN